MGLISDLIATSMNYFKIGLTGPRLKASSANLLVRNTDDSADAEVTTSKLKVSGDAIEINSDAGDTGNDRKLVLKRNPAATTGALTVIFPVYKGTDGHVFRQKAGTDPDVIELEGVASGSTESADKVDTTSLAFGSSSPVTAFTLPANAVVNKVVVTVDTAFNGTAPTMSVGISGTTSKYMPATAVDLKTVSVYEYHPGLVPDGSTNDIIITYAADGSSAGAARVEVFYAIPT